MWIPRYFETEDNFLRKDKVNIIYGSRRTGKSSLIEKLLKDKKGQIFKGNGDDLQLRMILGSENQERILSNFRNYDIIFIDEAQRIKNIGWGLKILIDNFKDKLIIATGSSSFQLSSQLGEPLTGRSNSSHLYPISILELEKQIGGMQITQNLENYLIYGAYPEVLTSNNNNDKKEYLSELMNSYLLKDILELENIRNSNQIFLLLKLLAFQIGNEVSFNELSNSLEISKHTVKRYIDLLEKSFVIKNISAYSGNLRNEIRKANRYYFYDNGIRNAIINNFSLPENRNDTGMLWENFMVMERIKKQQYLKAFKNFYFWRTYDKKEVDLIEESDGKLQGFEFKWNPKKAKLKPYFTNSYKNASLKIIHRENFLSFLT